MFPGTGRGGLTVPRIRGALFFGCPSIPLDLVFDVSKPASLFAWTRAGFFRAHVFPRPPESNGAERWSSMEGTLIAIRVGGPLPKSAVGVGGGGAELPDDGPTASPIWSGGGGGGVLGGGGDRGAGRGCGGGELGGGDGAGRGRRRRRSPRRQRCWTGRRRRRCWTGAAMLGEEQGRRGDGGVLWSSHERDRCHCRDGRRWPIQDAGGLELTVE